MFDLEEKIRTLPQKSGVYIMKNADGEVIYVAKAKILKNRVRQYSKNHNHPPKVQAMVDHVASFEYILSDNEFEAFVLENNLIKKYSPKYNILLKDDKTYPFLKITLNEDYPRMFVTRKVLNDGARYFGPYLSSQTIRELCELIKDMFMVRSCSKQFNGEFTKSRPCLYYHIGKCSGVCAGLVTKEQYRGIINDVISFLNGDFEKFTKQIRKEMLDASQRLDFEKAALCRDRLKAIESISKKQKIVSPDGNNTDIIAKHSANGKTCIEIFFVRGGSMIGKEHYYLNNTADIDDASIISDFIMQYYSDATFIPSEIFVQYEIADLKETESFLKSVSGKPVHIKTPKIGDNYKLVKMVEMNAKKELSEYELKIARDAGFINNALAGLMRILNLNGHPMRIEAYDISNISGTDNVGAMVTFKDGKRYTDGYRNFKIKTVDGQDDYASMKEMITRRFSEAKKGKDAFKELPDLVLIDGGYTHVLAAKEVMDKYVPDIPVFGIVKDDKHATRGLVSPNGEIPIDKKSDEFMLLTRIQDEMHRRAITYHSSLREKRNTYSELDDIPKIGDVRKKALLKHFKSIKKIKNASFEELMLVKELDRAAALSVYNHFKKGTVNND